MVEKKDTIFWPEGIRPENYPVHSYNSHFINKPPEFVWQRLISINDWSKWYSNSRWVKLLSKDNKLNFGTKFRWWTFNVPVYSEVIEFKPFESLGWTAKEFLAEGYHGWRLVPQNGGTLVVTEEVQKGIVLSLFPKIIKRMLEKGHQNWLESI